MISALLVLQLEAGVLQVTGQTVALHLQLVRQLLGPLVGALQLPELWELQNEAPRLVVPLNGTFYFLSQAAAVP